MKPSHVKAALTALFGATFRVPFLWGPMGIGKSDVVRQIADALGVGFIDLRAVLLDPVDLRGLPYREDETTRWATPEFLPREGEGILFLDELNSAPPLVQAACYQLILDRKLGEYEVPKGWHVLAAGNRKNDRGVTFKMPAPLANRLIHIDFEVDNKDWERWALDNDVRTEVIAFLRFKPDLLFAFEPNEKAFPTPRSWAFVSDVLKSNMPVIGDETGASIEHQMIAGCVGEGAAAEFMGFLRVYRQLPSPEACLMDPHGATVPADPSARYAITVALARRANPENFGRLVEYLDRFIQPGAPPETSSEFAVLGVIEAARKCPEIQQTRDYILWQNRNQAVTAA